MSNEHSENIFAGNNTIFKRRRRMDGILDVLGEFWDSVVGFFTGIWESIMGLFGDE